MQQRRHLLPLQCAPCSPAASCTLHERVAWHVRLKGADEVGQIEAGPELLILAATQLAVTRVGEVDAAPGGGDPCSSSSSSSSGRRCAPRQ
jgi:hypothetical protein